MEAGKLRNRVRIESPGTPTRGAMGSIVPAWEEYATVYANVEPLRMREFVAARAAQVEVDLRVTVRFKAGILPSWRVVWNGANYPIVSVVNVEGRNKSLELLCQGEAQAS